MEWERCSSKLKYHKPEVLTRLSSFLLACSVPLINFQNSEMAHFDNFAGNFVAFTREQIY